MKISSDKPDVLTGGASPLDPSAGVGQATQFTKPASVGSTGDQLTLSPEARMLQAAADAASQEPAIRPEAVARMRELLAKGELGSDPDKLADAIIDNWLHAI